jgi:hypothetical protein
MKRWIFESSFRYSDQKNDQKVRTPIFPLPPTHSLPSEHPILVWDILVTVEPVLIRDC